ncbi:MAG: hypothetical protein NC453_26135 [Muribaculum sp.]|nr:hypothetical protein [Muribaculum sp.]
MKEKIFFLKQIMIFFCCCALWACSSDDGPDGPKTYNERAEIELTSDTRTTSNELEAFYLNFTTDMARYADSTPGFDSDNIVVSPLSVAMLFAMTANGVDEATSKAYAEYLGVSDLNSLNELCSTLIKELPKVDTSATFKLANSIWVNKGMNVSLANDFSSIMSRYYKAETRNEDFTKNNGKTLDKINAWCADKTNGLIPNMLEQLNPDSYAVLLNALYFKAAWEEGLFDKSMTATATFHGEKRDNEVDMMESSRYFDGYIAEDDNFEYLFMTFGNEAYQLRIVIPKGNVTLQESATMLTPERYNSLVQESSHKMVKLFLPKFFVKNKYSLNDMLTASRASNLTDNITMTMFNNDVNGSVLYTHATSFSIDETGAEAAAVTSEEFFNSVNIDKDGFATVKVDSPFYFFITEWSTGACILSGRIANL